jgi:glycerophosphoryl diester phosphodiesterase
VAINPCAPYVTPELVTAAHATGLAVHVWTCDDPERIRWFRDIGADGLITNDPALAIEALQV